jgi:hypothetical protein
MYSPKLKTEEKKSKANASSVVQKKSSERQGFVFVDSRPESVTQKKLQEMAINNSVSNPIQRNKNVIDFREKRKTASEPMHAIQAKYYNADTNKVTDRPTETETITDEKKKVREKAQKHKSDVQTFTAHHKYPWNQIKVDIEAAFKAPKDNKSESVLTRLENWSGKTLPISRDSFLKDVDRRKNMYARKESNFDSWIQNVCWVPSNIFIGPLSNIRIDDPSKRTGDDDFDAHYKKRERRMTMRSEQLKEIFEKGGFRKIEEKFQTPSTGEVASFDPEEWQKHEQKEGENISSTPMYSQKGDPYFEKNIFPYEITSSGFSNMDYKKNSYDLEITTPSNVEKLEIKYDEKELGPTEKQTKILKMDSNIVQDKKIWTVKVPTPEGYIFDNFKIAMAKDNRPNEPKKMALKGIKLKRISTN